MSLLGCLVREERGRRVFGEECLTVDCLFDIAALKWLSKVSTEE